jgi:hypothetical protein
LASAGPFPTHKKDTEAIGFTLRNMGPQFSFALDTEPDEGNWPTPIFRELRPAKWGSGRSLRSSDPEPLMSALGQKHAERGTDVRFAPESGHRH